MKVAIIYKSLTGNTKLVAEAVRDALPEGSLVYFGTPEDGIEAELYLLGSWTDKGNCDGEIAEFIKKLENKKIAFFGTAGFGGSQEYYDKLFARVRECVLPSNEVLGSFYCQGRMPMSVRDRYVAMLREHPEDKKLEVNVSNFDAALSHPDEQDRKEAAAWALAMLKAAGE